MDRDDILARSRQEHRDRDLMELEINLQASTVGSITATALTAVFFIIQWSFRGEWNFGLYAILLSIGSATYITKAVQLKRRRDIVPAIIYTAGALALSAIHLYSLIKG